MAEQITRGPFRFEFLPDGDDPGTGAVRLTTYSGLIATTPFGVSRAEWEQFAGGGRVWRWPEIRRVTPRSPGRLKW